MEVVSLPGRHLGQVRKTEKEKTLSPHPKMGAGVFGFFSLLNFFLAFMSNFISVCILQSCGILY